MAVFLELLAAFWTLAGTTPSAVDRPPRWRALPTGFLHPLASSI